MDRTGGIIGTVSQAGRRGFYSSSGGSFSNKLEHKRPPGLGNWDNSCFQNSILQGLASLKPLPKYLASHTRGSNLARGKLAAVETLRTLVAQLNDVSNYGKTLWTPAALKSMNTWQQQDAQEYYSKLLDEIDIELAKVARATRKLPGLETDTSGDESSASQHSDDSGYQSLSPSVKQVQESALFKNPLEGLIAQRVACVACGYSEGLSMIPFNCLTLNLGVNKSQHDLYERLDAYTRVETIDGVECAKCTLLKVQRLLSVIIERSRGGGMSEEQLQEPVNRLAAVQTALEDDDFDDKTIKEKCKISAQNKVSSTKTKQIVIARPPQSLVVHMNRSVFDESTGHMFKNLAAVRFPVTLDLGPWCLGSSGGPGTSGVSDDETTDNETNETTTSSAGVETEQWRLEPKESMISGDVKPSMISGPIYELRAVVTHYGRHENGHYVCYRKLLKPPGSATVEPSKVDVAEETEVNNTTGKKNQDTFIELDVTPPANTPPEDDEANLEWWRLSDESVSKVTEDTVLAQGGVFMLFYDCVDPRSVLTSELNPLEVSDDKGLEAKETPSTQQQNLASDQKSAPISSHMEMKSGFDGVAGLQTTPTSGVQPTAPILTT
jgi:ubiquitin carboxyl-terminal hydrolase 1